MAHPRSIQNGWFFLCVLLLLVSFVMFEILVLDGFFLSCSFFAKKKKRMRRSRAWSAQNEERNWCVREIRCVCMSTKSSCQSVYLLSCVRVISWAFFSGVLIHILHIHSDDGRNDWLSCVARERRLIPLAGSPPSVLPWARTDTPLYIHTLCAIWSFYDDDSQSIK